MTDLTTAEQLIRLAFFLAITFGAILTAYGLREAGTAIYKYLTKEK